MEKNSHHHWLSQVAWNRSTNKELFPFNFKRVPLLWNFFLKWNLSYKCVNSKSKVKQRFQIFHKGNLIALIIDVRGMRLEKLKEKRWLIIYGLKGHCDCWTAAVDAYGSFRLPSRRSLFTSDFPVSTTAPDSEKPHFLPHISFSSRFFKTCYFIFQHF